jgi:hypothetical protein
MKFFLPNPSGPAPLLVFLVGFYGHEIEASFKHLAESL